MMRTHIKLDTRGLDKVEREIGVKAQATMRSLANHIVDDINSNWYGTAPPNQYPPTSIKGGTPFVRTGELRNSVRMDMRDMTGRFTSNPNAYAVTIRYGADHAQWLESTSTLDRPFLRPALDRAFNLIGYFAIRTKLGKVL